MIIRRAKDTDAEALAAIHGHYVRNTLITFTTVEKSLRYWQNRILSDPPVFVADRAGCILGFGLYDSFRNGPGYAYTAEHSIYLAPDAQGHGAGRTLLSTVETEAGANGIHVLVAGISSANPVGLKFHAAMGYSETGRLSEVGFKNGQWLDTIFMQKFLSPGSQVLPDGTDKKG